MRNSTKERALLIIALLAMATATASAQTTRALPDRLSASEFWKLVSDVSEPGGYFRIEDNYTSNEMEVGQLFTMLRGDRIQGDVYIGVGPEQNFSYIAAVRPRMAFIVDIRRQAVMQHLMYKAIFELAHDRADFISLLFSKPRPAGLDSATTIQRMWEAFAAAGRDTTLQIATYARIVERLTRTHGFTLTADESRQLTAVYDAFQVFGPGITTRGSMSGRGGSASFVNLTAYSFDATGEPRSFLSSEENFRVVKSLHDKNLIVPVSGDFGGAKAVRAIGAYLKERGGTVRAFYVSNVEQYLFQDAKQRAFYDNVATLPVDSASVFIRPYSMRRGGGGATRSLCPIASFLRTYAIGRVVSNNDALACMM